MAATAATPDTSDLHTTAGRRTGWLTPSDGATTPGARLLDADPDLARRLDPAVRDRLSPLLRVRVERIDRGVWRPAELAPDPEAFGLLILDGLMLRDLSVNERCCAELVGPGDLLRPWLDAANDEALVPSDLQWNVVDGPARVAVIDRRASVLIGRFPVLVCGLLDRTLQRARTLQFQFALSQVHGIDQRLELLLWGLADRWGRVTIDGVVLPLQLTHEMLGRLIGARRPSVTTALRRLADRGAVLRTPTGWALRDDPRTAAAPLPGAPLTIV